MSLTYKASTGEGITTGGTGSLVTDNSAITGYQTFTTALADGEEVAYSILYPSGDANEAVWEECTGVWTEATRTLTRVYVDGSAGSAHTVTTTAEVRIVAPTKLFTQLELARNKYISFDVTHYLTRTSTTGVTIAAGQAVVDEELLTWSQSAETPTVTTAGLWHIYLYDNAGTADFEYSQTAPQKSVYGYWRSGTDETRRLIGWYLVWDDSATKKIVPFEGTFSGGVGEIIYGGDESGTDFVNYDEFRMVSVGATAAAVNPTAFDLVGVGELPYDLLPKAAISHWMTAVKIPTAGVVDSDGIGILHPNLPAGATTAVTMLRSSMYTVRAANPRASANTFFGRFWMPYLNTNPYYSIYLLNGSIGIQVELWGGRVTL